MDASSALHRKEFGHFAQLTVAMEKRDFVALHSDNGVWKLAVKNPNTGGVSPH